ncbi:MAG TPA: hypothetical protein VKI00_25020 [Mycobacterium sp.]|uniref:hypothetical protein n=1 Tax=Mycobacterium sp. TaxID=1785 RepID=UPI002C721261|nr:hypothetical protein [Mycobacterium sp.]HME78793.1 hypothetical protein [Mycobacterium sp.]
MLEQRRLLLAVGAAAGGLVAAALLQTPLAHADPCNLGECTLVSGGSPTDVLYQGFRPYFEEWTDNQPTNVDVAGSSFAGDVSGSYDVSELDLSTQQLDDVTYHFGDFTPAADNPSGIDSDGLAGATVYDVVLGPGAKTVDGATTYDLQNLSVFLGDGDHVTITTDPGEFTNYLYSTPTDSGDWIEYAGSSTPTLIYDTLTNSQFPSEIFNIANYFPPDDWLPDFYSMLPPGLT